MRFAVTRTSCYANNFPPFPGAVSESLTVTRLDRRSAPTLAEASTKSWYRDWLAEGKNHREETYRGLPNVVCDRQERELFWFVEMDSLAELLQFMTNSNCRLVLKITDYVEVPYEIEIYDDYRE